MSLGVSSETYKRQMPKSGTFEFSGGDTPSGAVLRSGLTGRFGPAANPSIFDGSVPAKIASVLDPNAAANTSPISRVTGNPYKAAGVNVTTNSFQVGGAVNGGHNATCKVDAGAADIKKNMDNLKQDFKDVRTVLCEAVRDVSSGMGIDGNLALRSMGAIDEDIGKGQIMGASASGFVMGPVVTSITAVTGVISQIKQDAGNISVEKQSEIIALALARIREQQSGPGGFLGLENEKGGPAPKPNHDYKHLKVEQAASIIGGSEKDDPAYKILEAQMAAVNGVRENHAKVVHGAVASLDDIEKISGAAAMIDQLLLAGAEARQDGPGYDATSMMLAGESLAGYKRMKLGSISPEFPSVTALADRNEAANSLQYVLAPKVSAGFGLRA